MSKKLIIVDISNFIFRAFYAIRPLTSPDGTPVNAVHGVFSMLLKLMSQYQPTHIVLARDVRGGTFRNEIYPEYKAHRSEPPEELIAQFPLIESLIEKMKIPVIVREGYEADDVIASVATQWHGDFDEVLIASGDKDLMQLVEDNVRVLDTMKDVIYDADAVYEKMGVYPHQIVDYLSILGDSSDNIPGMKGIGAKGAAKLLAEYGSLDECIKNKDKLANKRVKNAFEEHMEEGHLSRKLVNVVKDLDLGKSSNDLEFRFYPEKELIEFLSHLGLKSLVKKVKELAYIDDQVSADIQDSGFQMSGSTGEFDYKINQVDENSLEKTLAKLARKKELAVFPLWSSYDVRDRFVRNLISIACATEDKEVFLFYFKGESVNLLDGEQAVLSEDAFKNIWKTIFHNDGVEIICHDWKQFLFHGWVDGLEDATCKYFDTSIAHYCLEPDLKHDIDYIINAVTGLEPMPFNPKSVMEIEHETRTQVVAHRSQAMMEMFQPLKKRIDELGLSRVFYEIDLPLVPVLAKMEFHGIGLNVGYFEELEKKFSKTLNEIEKKIEEVVGEPINLRSPKQVSHLLYDVLELPTIKKTKTGFSTNSEVLEELDAYYDSEVPGLILQYREYDKLLSTYVKTFPILVNQTTGKLHTTFSQITAATGRLSSENPNIQNIPVRNESGRLLRKGFIATPGNLLLSSDYSQVELRIVAHMSEDKVMVDAFKHDRDIHIQTASEIFGVEENKVTREQRSAAKAVNFGLIYGQSSFGLSQSLHISRREAQDYIEAYFKNFHAVRSFLDSLKEECEKTGYAETIFGRKRILKDINSSNRTMKSVAERVSINSPIQGTASDIIKIAMINIDKELTDKKMRSKMLLQVHDELIFDVCEDELSQMKELVRRNMEDAVKFKVPLKVDMGIGVNWFDLK